MTSNNLISGNCIPEMRKMVGGSIDLIVTDPPYKITARGGYTSSGGLLLDEKVRAGEVFTENNVEISDYISDLYRVLKVGGHCYIMTNNKNITHFLKVIDASDFHFIKNLIWVKDNKIMSQAYMSQFEYILFLRKGKFEKINMCGTSDVILSKNPKNKSHPSEKPIGLMKTLIQNSSNVDDTVFDPFMGSGSTGIACKQLNRKFVGIELDEKYFNVAKKRINETKPLQFMQ